MSDEIVFDRDDHVRSDRFGLGAVVLDSGGTVVVRFEHGIEECEKASLVRVSTPLQAMNQPVWHAPLRVITRLQAEAIQSVNDTWGIFSTSRIQLLPHQLWVCRRVNETWPTRWLVADDVGLGKTIEAGLIMLPLLSRETVKRLLILCPAKLVPQWQYRLRTMFDIRTVTYLTAADTQHADFWTTHHRVVASLDTLKADRSGRHARLAVAPSWDLLIVDEAHHLNNDENSGATQGYRLVEHLVEDGKVESMVFFTGTPHRGKNFGFLSLLRLLRPDLFDPRMPLEGQLPCLNEVMIRNNKQNVTDLRGMRLFQRPRVTPETYYYSPAEKHFYDLLTDFIISGKAYASSLDATTGRAVMLVLVTLQKLASSSVAAIRRALQRRLTMIVEQRQQLEGLEREREQRARDFMARYAEGSERLDDDELNRLDEQISALWDKLQLMEDEEPQLEMLVQAANQVVEETKIARIISLLETVFADRPVLFFTEYKATQSLLMSALIRRFGDGCVTFINGDERADDVVDSRGTARSLWEKREVAAARFNDGHVRFLVSTEAGGEGIDLQERCHSLIHVDLPWNPMRLHQRVGRLNRFGQTKRVEVITLRNPDTVEARIWDKLTEKMEHVERALGQVMDEPEDLTQLVLGMTSPSLFRDIFANAPTVPRGSFSTWFDQQTARFGGEDALTVVRELVGHSAKFDFQQMSPLLPRLDLPALRPFFISMLALNGRRIREDDGTGLSFTTPDAWRHGPGIQATYSGVVFDRAAPSKGTEVKLAGVGYKLFDQALRQARAQTEDASVATVTADVLKRPLVVCRIADRLTSQRGAIRSVVVAAEVADGAQPMTIMQDWELLERLNALTEQHGFRRAKTSARPSDVSAVCTVVDEVRAAVEARVPELELPFKRPLVEVLAVLWPITPESDAHAEPDSDNDLDDV